MLASALAAVSVPAMAQQQTGFDRINFVKAVREGDWNKVAELYDKYDKVILDAHDTEGETALTISIRKRLPYTLWFLGKGANPNEPGANGDTPLIVAASVNATAVAEQLITLKAEVDAENRRGETALITAVQAGHAPMVKLLLESGADPEKRDNFGGRSARDYAKMNSRNKSLLALIEATKPKPPAPSADDFKL